jgi:hypothetical protein
LFGKPGLNIQDGEENSIIIDSISEENDLYQKWSPKPLAFGANVVPTSLPRLKAHSATVIEPCKKFPRDD